MTNDRTVSLASSGGFASIRTSGPSCQVRSANGEKGRDAAPSRQPGLSTAENAGHAERALAGAESSAPTRKACGSDCGTLSGVFSQVSKRLLFAAKVRFRQQLTDLWLVAVTCGCLWIVGIVFSTVSAQPHRALPCALPVSSVGGTTSCRRKGSRRSRPAVETAANFVRPHLSPSSRAGRGIGFQPVDSLDIATAAFLISRKYFCGNDLAPF